MDWLTFGGWWHVDQNAKNESSRGKVCFQGQVSYYDADEFTGGLCVVAGSHKYHNELCARYDEQAFKVC
jgi:ectoine hydroxylase-related dioxygenase (phytanoyl-CoA dioxygenase family)